MSASFLFNRSIGCPVGRLTRTHGLAPTVRVAIELRMEQENLKTPRSLWTQW